MHTPNKMMPIQKFAAARTKAQLSAKHSQKIAKLAGETKPQRPTPAKPSKPTVAPAPTPKRSTGLGDKLKARMGASKAAGAADIRKSANVRIAVK